MKKLYFKTTGQEPDVNCVEQCFHNSNNNTNQPYCMIGSAKCQECQFCFGWDREEHWVKCLEYSLLESKDKDKTLEAMNWWKSLDRVDKIFWSKGKNSVVEITENQIENIYNEQFNK